MLPMWAHDGIKTHGFQNQLGKQFREETTVLNAVRSNSEDVFEELER